MNQLYPIIRRVRRPLLPPEPDSGERTRACSLRRPAEDPVTELEPVSQVAAAVTPEVAPTLETRPDLRRFNRKEKAE